MYVPLGLASTYFQRFLDAPSRGASFGSGLLFRFCLKIRYNQKMSEAAIPTAMGAGKRGESHEGRCAVALVGKNLRVLLVAWAVAGLFVPPVDSADLKAETVA